jgi:hypothetical protein
MIDVRPGWAYRTASGTLLRGPCPNPDCTLMSPPGGGWHDGPCMGSGDYYGLSNAIPYRRIAGHAHEPTCWPLGPKSGCPEWGEP